MLAVIETHPVQYHAPVYRELEQACGVPVTAIYGSDFSIAGYRDREFNHTFAWDTDLISGYGSIFLSRVNGQMVSDADGVSARGLWRALTSVSPDAVLVLGYSPAFHRAAWLAALRLGKPLLFRGETTDLEHRTGVAARAKSTALRAAYAQCAGLLYIGRRSHAHFTALGVPDDRLHFSPYCVDDGPFRAGETDRQAQRGPARAELDVREDEILILYAGKLSERKGVDLIVPALRQLVDRTGRRTSFVALGDGEMRDRIVRQAEEYRVPARVVGFHNQSALSRFYHAADLLVLPSRRSETWGLVVNEALLHGVPVVVSTQVGCAPDLVDNGRTGVTFDGSPHGLSHAFEAALPLAGRYEVRDACRTLVAAYSIQAAAEGIARAYRAVTGS